MICSKLMDRGDDMILVSACLAGVKVRYDGADCFDERIERLIRENKATYVCPEVLGGLSTPREPAEIVGGDGAAVLDGKAKVVNRRGVDVTEEFVEGAYKTLEKAQELGATAVVLKENSPSCGGMMIYDGTFTGTKTVGAGVTAALLKRNNITVMSEKNFNK